jgi:hypothetical protein
MIHFESLQMTVTRQTHDAERNLERDVLVRFEQSGWRYWPFAAEKAETGRATPLNPSEESSFSCHPWSAVILDDGSNAQSVAV